MKHLSLFKRRLTSILSIATLTMLPHVLWANNIQISNIAASEVNETLEELTIDFNISWENSWRDATNEDAAWIFIKYKEQGSTEWHHATVLSFAISEFSSSTMAYSTDGMGAFLYRNANGSGNVNFTDVNIVWDYGTDGVTNPDNVDIRLYAIEMVYVPQGSFYVGDGASNNFDIYGNFEQGLTGNPFQISGEGALTLGGGAATSLGNNNRDNQFVFNGPGNTVNCQNDGCLGVSGDDFDDVNSQSLPAAFPKGFNGFYCMKYEMTQQQFVEMLNTCTPTQQNLLATETHFVGGNPDNLRFDITESNGVYSTADPYAPMIYCDWIRAAAYADWSGLRPMTEFEFEKAARGTSMPVVNEYPWGNDQMDLSTNLTLSNQGAAIEAVLAGYNAMGVMGNCWINSGSHNMAVVARVGIFAANAGNTGRVTSGASIWGIMELGGNAWERAVSVGHPEGRKFTGSNGDGTLDIQGYANNADWPGTEAGGIVNTNVGVGYRGGGLAYPSPDIFHNARISSRRLASGYWDIVINDDGARFVRNN